MFNEGDRHGHWAGVCASDSCSCVARLLMSIVSVVALRCCPSSTPATFSARYSFYLAHCIAVRSSSPIDGNGNRWWAATSYYYTKRMPTARRFASESSFLGSQKRTYNTQSIYYLRYVLSKNRITQAALTDGCTARAGVSRPSHHYLPLDPSCGYYIHTVTCHGVPP